MNEETEEELIYRACRIIGFLVSALNAMPMFKHSGILEECHQYITAVKRWQENPRKVHLDLTGWCVVSDINVPGFRCSWGILSGDRVIVLDRDKREKESPRKVCLDMTGYHVVADEFGPGKLRQWSGITTHLEWDDRVLVLRRDRECQLSRMGPERPGLPVMIMLALHICEQALTGCCLHVVLDDENVYDSAVQECIREAERSGHQDCLLLAQLLLCSTIETRLAVVRHAQTR